MGTKTISIKIPSDIPERKVKLIVAIELYSEGSITLKQAADLAEMTVWDFLHELGRMKVPFTNIDIDDFREELEGLS